jgi:hypothetical protein
MKNGAVNLRKAIKRLQALSTSPLLLVTQFGSDLIRIEKRSGESGNRTEFSFTIRVEGPLGHETWWPIEYSGTNGEIIKAETQVNGRTLVNLSCQNDLIEVAETWARTLEAQHVTQTVGNALL